MNTRAFTGGAGTGKTRSLLRELENHLAVHPLSAGQRVLALTFMHGSRHRLAERLAKSSARRHFDCITLDHFSWEICHRWRSRLRTLGDLIPLEALDYDGICAAAGRLLACADVAQWVAKLYPVVVLDEFQDCAPVRLSLASHLHGQVEMLIAADDFQNLGCTGECPAILWLRELGVGEELTTNQRTSDRDLIAAAQALRAGTALVEGDSSSFKIISAPSPHLAASFVSTTLAPPNGKEAVLLSAARPGTSPWVDKIVEFISTRKYGKDKKVGPISIRWEMTAEGLVDKMIATLGIVAGNTQVEASAILSLPRSPMATQLNRWAEHQRRVLGRNTFSTAEVHAQIRRAAQHLRSITSVSHDTRRAMTIHQAKNREFLVVIVLWPLRVRGDATLARRLLYNAITRAKRRAIVIVEDPNRNRLNKPPFAYPE